MATCCESSSSSSSSFSSSKEATSYLILGDGDFSFSYDLARRILLESSSSCAPTATAASLVSSSSSHASTTSPSPPVPPPLFPIHVTATGIDTRSEVESKYKDSLFLLKKLKGLSITTTTTNLTISVQHGVNAILSPPTLALVIQPVEASQSQPCVKDEEDSSNSNSRPPPADIVIFNHPHLGVEDAHLHARFLAHLLESVHRYWLKKKRTAAHDNANAVGIFYLTLALGQWERWKGREAAARIGLFIINRLPFQAPLTAITAVDTAVDDHDTVVKPYFQLRRHQTGKSFANRRKANASETFALGRLADKDILLQNSSSARLFWYNPTPTVYPETTTRAVAAAFSCPFCNRTFTEQRSVKNHILCKHANHEPDRNSHSSVTRVDGVEQKHDTEHSQRRLQQQDQEWECPYCNNNTSTTRSHIDHVSKRPRRVFNNQQALNDHIKAKHQALHSHIPPDYKTTSCTEAVVAVIAEGSEQQPEQTLLDAATKVPQQPFGHCDICLEVFENAQGARHHMDRFIPPPTTVATTMMAPVSSELEMALKQFACSFCAKTFREKRARLQHENFCSFRPEASVDLGQS